MIKHCKDENEKVNNTKSFDEKITRDIAKTYIIAFFKNFDEEVVATKNFFKSYINIINCKTKNFVKNFIINVFENKIEDITNVTTKNFVKNFIFEKEKNDKIFFICRFFIC